MRKCVSMVAVASATLGLAACSATDRGREPAAASQPLGAQGAGHAPRVHAAPVAVAPAAAGAVPAQRGAQAPNQSAARAAASGVAPSAVAASGVAAPSTAAPVLIPSSTTDAVPQPPHPRPAAAPALAPAPPRPAPPPPSAQDAHAPDQAPASDPAASVTAQIVDAVAAARMDGKAVLLDFGADWCTACRALDKAMHTPKAQAVLAQYYHVVHIDLGNGDPQHMALATQYDPVGTFGMPLLVVLNPDGTVRADSARSGQPKYDEAGLAAWLNQWAR